MSSIWLLILILVFLLALGAAVFIYWMLKRARRISFTADPAVKAQPDPKNPAPSEFLNYASGLELRTSFKRSLRLLKSYVTGRDYRYRVPWFLMTGESESGKTTILDANGVNLSANGSASQLVFL
jgi:type VI secretion system protein ImpL